MNDSAIQRMITEARRCALVMLGSASFIQSELPNVRMSDSLRSQANQICRALAGTKHDIINELDEFDELHDAMGSSPATRLQIGHIVRWIQNDIDRMHKLVVALKSASEQDPMCLSACVLLTEPATNILNAFNRFKMAANSLRFEAGDN